MHCTLFCLHTLVSFDVHLSRPSISLLSIASIAIVDVPTSVNISCPPPIVAVPLS